jgi:hypothetical protein
MTALTIWPLRLALLVHAAMAVAQPVLAGSYLAGSYDVLATHGLNGSLLVVATMLWGVVALVHVVATRGRTWWLLPAAVAIFLAEGIEIGAGHSRNLALHIPLGVFIVLAAVLLAGWSFTPSATRTNRTAPPRTTMPPPPAPTRAPQGVAR